MATKITPPPPYSSVKNPVIFGITRDLDSVIEVTINGCQKILPKDACQVNVSHYWGNEFTTEPCVTQDNLFVVHGQEDGRLVRADISIDGVTSESVPLICADTQPPRDRIMSDLRRRVIARGQIDEMSVFMTSPGVIAYAGESVSVDAGITCVCFRVPNDSPASFSVYLHDADGVDLDRIDYQVESKQGVRLAWINKYGAIDYWNYQNRRKSAMKVTKDKIYTETGYITTSVQSEITETVSTQALPEPMVNALRQVFTASQAWVIEDQAAREIDITTETITSYEADKLCSLQIDFRNKSREL